MFPGFVFLTIFQPQFNSCLFLKGCVVFVIMQAASFSLHELPWQWVCGLAIVLIGIVLTGLALPK